MADYTIEEKVYFEFNVQCSECGGSLNSNIKTNRRGDTLIEVEHCQCIINKKEEEIQELNHQIEQQDHKITSLEDEIDILRNKEVFIEILKNGDKIKI